MKILQVKKSFVALVALCGIGAFSVDSKAEEGVSALLNMSFEDLTDIQVTSVSKKLEKASEAAAAIHVVTAEDIRRGGFTTIAEALRMVPGLEVARTDSNRWAIAARGFNSQFVNKLLVMVDGRSVYTPLFSGTYWDVQDTVLEDIDRIEIIRGPGATLWGANAVNGVINIITKSAKHTQGNYMSVLAGNEERGTLEARHGGEVNDVFYRIYAKGFERDESKEVTSNVGSKDDWRALRTGFRLDWDNTDDSYTLQGDAYMGENGQPFTLPGSVTTDDDEKFNGANIIGKWRRQVSADSVFDLKFYLDYVERDMSILNQDRYTFDIDFQHAIDTSERNEIVWGGGFRYFADQLNSKTVNGSSTLFLDYDPRKSDNQLFSAFIQNKYAVIPDELFLTIGSKFEDNFYTDFEYQPNIRFSWLPTDNQTFWGAISRAIRVPSRGEQTLGQRSGNLIVQGNTEVQAEELTAYELGYRVEPHWRASIDATLFFNDYENMRSFEPVVAPNIVPIGNKSYAETYGFEISTRFSVTNDWNLYANYSMLGLDIHVDKRPANNAFDASIEANESRSPKNQFNLMSRMNLPYDLELDTSLYYVDVLSSGHNASIDIPEYVRVDARLGWKPLDGMEVSVIGTNLTDQYHEEFSASLYSVTTKVGRSVFGKLALEF